MDLSVAGRGLLEHSISSLDNNPEAKVVVIRTVGKKVQFAQFGIVKSGRQTCSSFPRPMMTYS